MENKNLSTRQTAGSFLNGRAQVIELLQKLTPSEKIKILNQLKVKNPQLAQDLTRESFSFEQIGNLSNSQIQALFEHVSPPIIGMALKGTNTSIQRKLLSLAPRSYAEEAYVIMTSTYREEMNTIRKAQEKVLNTIYNLFFKKEKFV